MAKILVTGATGAAGRTLVPALRAAGHTVRGQYRTASGSDPDVEWVQCDLTRSLQYAPLLAGCDGVIHLAAELRKAELMDATNVDATSRLLTQAAEHGVRYFGYASSIVVYGSPRRRLVDENSPRIDPQVSIVRQYHAEPYMLDYARTKAAAEIAIEAVNAPMIVDLYRPAVVLEDNMEVLRAYRWSDARKIFASYRRTQFITAADTSAAIIHLMERALGPAVQIRRPIEAYNIVDRNVLTYAALFARAYEATGDARFKVAFNVPIVMDLVKDLVRYRNIELRYPLGMLEISADKLLATGFVFPVGFERALSEAIQHFKKSAN